MLTALGVVAAGKPKVDQSIQIGVGYGKNMASTTAIAAIGAAKLFVLLMPKRDTACAAVSRRDVNVGFVNEFHDQAL
jgi:hypothetical protein